MGALRTAILGIFLAASTAAMADPTTLVCSSTRRPDIERDVDLNEANGTATVSAEGISWGPSVAKFDSKSVTFGYFRKDVDVYDHFIIDRLTGVMSDYSSIQAPYDLAGPDNRFIEPFACQVGHAKF
jgi:hypothetical protein